jgi:molybdate transport system regulatory protein
MRVRYKVWLEKEGEPIISEGKWRLLVEIDRLGSIKEASESLGLSYKRAFSQIKAMEERLGFKVLERKRGSGARLTERGRRLVEEFDRIRRSFRELSLRVSEVQV